MMEIPGKVLQDIVQNSVKQGDVFLIEMDSQGGVTPKDGALTRNKFFVVLGFDNEGNVYGGVIINSRIITNAMRTGIILHEAVDGDEFHECFAQD